MQICLKPLHTFGKVSSNASILNISSSLYDHALKQQHSLIITHEPCSARIVYQKHTKTVYVHLWIWKKKMEDIEVLEVGAKTPNKFYENPIHL